MAKIDDRPAPSAEDNGNGRSKNPLKPLTDKDAVLRGNAKLIDLARQIVDRTPEIRTEKVLLLREAVEQDKYVVDVRKLANILIAKLFLDE